MMKEAEGEDPILMICLTASYSLLILQEQKCKWVMSGISPQVCYRWSKPPKRKSGDFLIMEITEVYTLHRLAKFKKTLPIFEVYNREKTVNRILLGPTDYVRKRRNCHDT